MNTVHPGGGILLIIIRQGFIYLLIIQQGYLTLNFTPHYHHWFKHHLKPPNARLPVPTNAAAHGPGSAPQPWASPDRSVPFPSRGSSPSRMSSPFDILFCFFFSPRHTIVWFCGDFVFFSKECVLVRLAFHSHFKKGFTKHLDGFSLWFQSEQIRFLAHIFFSIFPSNLFYFFPSLLNSFVTGNGARRRRHGPLWWAPRLSSLPLLLIHVVLLSLHPQPGLSRLLLPHPYFLGPRSSWFF